MKRNFFSVFCGRVPGKSLCVFPSLFLSIHPFGVNVVWLKFYMYFTRKHIKIIVS